MIVNAASKLVKESYAESGILMLLCCRVIRIQGELHFVFICIDQYICCFNFLEEKFKFLHNGIWMVSGVIVLAARTIAL